MEAQLAATAVCTLEDAESDGADALVRQLAEDDLLGQLLERRGRMRELGDEGGDLKLDWVDGVEQALAHPEWLEEVAAEARAIVAAGIRRVIWSGMGGSVQTVYCLQRMGFLDQPGGGAADAATAGRPGMSVHPLDSTDPASLNRVLREIAAREHVDLGALQGRPEQSRAAIKVLLDTTMLTGVSMGMTSEEPITHLEWFDGLLRSEGIAQPEHHLQVMTLPGSYLDTFARERQARMTPIQLDGQCHTPGRMSAPATRVFLRPVALALAAAGPDGTALAAPLADLLRRCQRCYGVSHTEDAAERRARIERDPFIRLGAYMAEEAARRGRNKLVLILPPAWRGLAPWVEQLVEESLGKGGKGWLIFYDQDLEALRGRDDCVFLVLRPDFELEPEEAALAALRQAGRPLLTLRVPVDDDAALPRRLPALAGLFASWKLAVAAFGYLRDIVIAGQPGVEAYKAYARELRDQPGAIPFPSDPGRRGLLRVNVDTVLGDDAQRREAFARRLAGLDGDPTDPADRLAALLLLARDEGRLRYLDFTYNGEVDAALAAVLDEARLWIGERALGLPVKLRTGPSDYHSTEQSETDGPAELVSIRMVALRHDEPLAGRYSDRFLLAQARGTWQAMRDAGRWAVLVTLPDSRDAAGELRRCFAQVAARLREATP